MEAATSSYSARGKFWQYIYFMLVVKNHHKIRSRCLIREFPFRDIFNDINHGYKASLLKKNSLCLHSFYMDMASYCHYEQARRTMNTAIVSYLFNHFYSFSAAELNNIENQSFYLGIFIQREWLWRWRWWRY